MWFWPAEYLAVFGFIGGKKKFTRSDGRVENRVSARVYRGVLWYTPIFSPENFGFLQGFKYTPRKMGF